MKSGTRTMEAEDALSYEIVYGKREFSPNHARVQIHLALLLSFVLCSVTAVLIEYGISFRL